MTPTPGRIVEYTLTPTDSAAINRRRMDRLSNAADEHSGVIVHVGNPVAPGDTYPLVITRVWHNAGEPVPPDAPVNGQVLLDGNDVYWVTSARQGAGEGCWRPYQHV